MTNELIKLIQENPELPIVPMVDSDVVCDDGGYWMGAWGHCQNRIRGNRNERYGHNQNVSQDGKGISEHEI